MTNRTEFLDIVFIHTCVFTDPIFVISGRGGTSGGKFHIALALPVAAVMNCADNTGMYDVSLGA